jgi:hypothetical protein
VPHLFAKQMSKHSIGVYIELFREVRASFEAVLTTTKATKDQGSDRRATFSRIIAELKRHKSLLI